VVRAFFRPPSLLSLLPLSFSFIGVLTMGLRGRSVRRSDERRTLQRPPLRARTPARPTRLFPLHFCHRRPRCRPDDDGVPDTPPRCIPSEPVCVPRGAAAHGVPVSAVSGQGVRGPNGLRRVWADDCELAPFGEELSSFVPRESIRGCVRVIICDFVTVIVDGVVRTSVGPEAAAACHACAVAFPTTAVVSVSEGVSPVGRYRCPECSNDFCAECDVFIHDVIHCCPGCGK
jgi:hypothetical protein